MRLKNIAGIGLSALLGACYDPAMAPLSLAPAPLPPATTVGQAVPAGYYLGTVVEGYLTYASVPAPLAPAPAIDIDLNLPQPHSRREATREAVVAAGIVTVAALIESITAAGQPAPPPVPVMKYIVLLDRGPSIAVSQLAQPSDHVLQPGTRAVVRTLDGYGIAFAADAIPPAVRARIGTDIQPPLNLGYMTIFDQPGYQCIGIGIDSTCHPVTARPVTVPMFPRG